MTSQERRISILRALQSSDRPLSASHLAARFGVSRQIVVGDVALLRASGTPVYATPRGYLLESGAESEGLQRVIACRHTAGQMPDELYAVVDNGGAVLDVIVEHAVYGQISGQLQIFSRYDVDQFIQKISGHQAHPLSQLTDGVHLHTIRCRDEESYLRILEALREKRVLLDE